MERLGQINAQFAGATAATSGSTTKDSLSVVDNRTGNNLTKSTHIC